MGEYTQDYAMRICIEYADQLASNCLDTVLENHKRTKKHKMALWTYMSVIVLFTTTPPPQKKERNLLIVIVFRT